VVPLSYQLKSGDQVAILTSKNKKPNPDWMKFVVTHKARTRIRHWLNEEHRETIRKGRELWDKKAKKAKLEVDEQDLHRYANTLNFPNTQQMFYEIGQGLFDIRELVQLARNGGRLSNQEESAELQPSSNLLRLEHERFLDQAQTVGKPALLIDGTRYEDMATSYAPCCNPIPGDPVFGYVGRTGGIKIHRKTCVNAPHLIRNDDRVVPVAWSRQKDLQFMSALRIVGEDRVGLISDMTELISKTMKTNIRSISGDTQDGVFEGTIVLDVNDLSHLRKLMERLRKVNGIFGVYRFEE
jgi:(p)ppGpp synthase/HD superfamily hydrolase